MFGSVVLAGRRLFASLVLASLCFTAASAAPLERPLPLSPEAFGSELSGLMVLPDDYALLPQAVARLDAPELFIVQLPEAPLASYQGELAGFAAPDRNERGRLDVNSAAARSYVAHLVERQQQVLAEAGQLLGRELDTRFTYQHAFNGMAVFISADEVQRLLDSGLIIHAEAYAEYPLLTDAGPEWIGAPAVWSGAAGSEVGTLGEGVVVGIIDSGININHPSFAAETEDGFVHTNPLGSGNFIGWCNPGVGVVTDTCNDKLIGTWEFLGGLGLDDLYIPGGEDENGHGSHVAGTVAGNPMVSNFGGGANPPVSGVAPRANIIAYDACYTTPQGQGLCPNVSTLAAINQVVADGIVDVINYSIGGGTEPWQQAISLAFLAAVDAGVFVSASAGNSGPGPNTMGHVQPWVASVAAASHNRYFAGASVSVSDPDAPPALVGIGAVPSEGPAASGQTGELRLDPDNLLGCTAFAAGFFDDAIAYVDRGVCPFVDKINNAVAAGAIGVVVGNSNSTAPILMGGTAGTAAPAVMITRARADELLAFADAEGPISVRLDTETPSAVVLDDSVGDIITGFSSRGPNAFNVTKPSVTAPGLQILAAVAAGGGQGAPEFGLLSGTSMSSPHNAGAAALLRALNPTWLPSEIQSALMLTARTGILADNGGPIDPATVFDEGAGRIQVDLAANTPLVLRETVLNFFQANPATGGDPRTLNLAGLSDDNCIGSCSFQRSFRSVADGPREFAVSLVTDSDLSATISPASFTVLPGQLQTVTFDIDSGIGADDWKFAQIVITPVSAASDTLFADRFEPAEAGPPGAAEAPLSMPVSIFARAAVIDVDDSPISASAGALGTATETLSFSNIGTADLLWAANASPAVAGDTVVSQGVDTGNGIASGFFTGLGTGAYSAEVFGLAEETRIGQMFFLGFVSGGLPLAANTSAIRFYLYADAGGVPAGHPEDGAASELWTATVANPSPGLDLSGSAIRLDLAQAGLDLPVLPAGRYWISAAPEFPGVNTRWNWLNATAGDLAGDAHIIAPGGAFAGIPDWTNLTEIDPVFANLAFSLDAAVSCGAPWLSVVPDNGTVAPGSDTTIELTFDAAGLAAGTYTTNLCLESNDLRNPVVSIPVSFVVTEDAAELQVAHLAPFADTLAGTEVDIALNGNVVLSAVAYGDSTGYLALAPGEYLIEIFPTGTTTAAITATANLEAGVRYAALARGDGSNQALGLSLLVDDIPTPADGNFLLRLGHLAPFADGSASAEVRLIDGTLVQAVDFADITGFIELAAGDYDLTITVPGGDPILIDPIELSFEAGDVISAFAVGDGDNQRLDIFALPPGAPGFFVPLKGDIEDAQVQIVHLAPFADTLAATEVDIAVNGTVILSDVPYGASTAYLPVAPGPVELEVREPGTPTVLISTSVELVPGVSYTVIANGDGDNQDLGLALLIDDFDAPAAGNFKLRLGHLAPFADGPASAEVRLADGTLIAPVDFGDVSGFLELPAGAYDLVITAPGGSPVLIDPTELSFAAGDVLSAFAAGDGVNQDLGVFALPVDAQGAFVDLRDPESLVRVAHLAPFAADLEDTEVDIAVNGTVVLSDVPYGGSTGYLSLLPGPTDLEVRAPGTATVLISASVVLEDRTAYSVVALGDGDNQPLSLLAVVDDLSAPEGGEFRLRLGHAAPFADGDAAAEVRLADGTLIAPVNFGDSAEFDLAEGAYDLRITAPGGDPIFIDPIELSFPEGVVLAAFAAGDGVNQPLAAFAWPADEAGFFLPLNADSAQGFLADFSGAESPELACSLGNIPLMPSLSFDLGAHAYINGLSWDTLLETQGTSWAEEAAILIGSSSNRAAIVLRPGAGVERPTVGAEPFSGAVPDLAALDFDFALDADGLLVLSFCETFVDPIDPNAIWIGGVLEINPDPESIETGGSFALSEELTGSSRSN